MQNIKKNYTFLLSHTTKSKIYIRRIEVSKKLIQSSIAIFIFTFGLVSVGVLGLIRTNVLAENDTPVSNETASVPNNKQTEINRLQPPDGKRKLCDEQRRACFGFAVNKRRIRRSRKRHDSRPDSRYRFDIKSCQFADHMGTPRQNQ